MARATRYPLPATRYPSSWPVWRLLTSVRFAIWLIAFLAVCSLLGVVLPQLPAPMRGNDDAVAAWVAFQKTRFGIFAPPLYRLGLFTVFSAPWFLAGLALLVVSVSVCTANRFAPIL